MNKSSLFNSLRPFLIAEAGINHNGSLAIAKKMILAAKEAGADAVKFQYFQKDRLINPYIKDSIAVIKILSKYFMTEKFAREVKLFGDKAGIPCFFTAFDVGAVDVLEKLEVKYYKLASGDIVNLYLQEKVCRTGKPVIFSAGAATLAETDKAFNHMKKINKDLSLLHCISLYPAQPAEMNLKTIPFLAKRYGIPVGLSDHTMGEISVLAAVALGARIIEKHFTLDRKMAGPDQQLSCNPVEFKKIRQGLDSCATAVGVPGKFPLERELKGNEWGRRSIVAVADIAAGNRIGASDIDLLRPMRGLPASEFGHVAGKKAKRNIKKGEWISDGDLGL